MTTQLPFTLEQLRSFGTMLDRQAATKKELEEIKALKEELKNELSVWEQLYSERVQLETLNEVIQIQQEALEAKHQKNINRLVEIDKIHQAIDTKRGALEARLQVAANSLEIDEKIITTISATAR